MAENRKKGVQDRLQRLRAVAGRFRARVRRHPVLNTTWRIGVFTVGVAVLAGGLVMMVTPGPGWAAIFIGLAILATEFAWAQRALSGAKEAAERAKNRALDPRVRRRNTIIAIVLGIAAAAAIVTYLALVGPRLPFGR
ncbi:MAG TPA: TIGR02611 family protein [Streptosporangiaceae bacterium]